MACPFCFHCMNVLSAWRISGQCEFSQFWGCCNSQRCFSSSLSEADRAIRHFLFYFWWIRIRKEKSLNYNKNCQMQPKWVRTNCDSLCCFPDWINADGFRHKWWLAVATSGGKSQKRRKRKRSNNNLPLIVCDWLPWRPSHHIQPNSYTWVQTYL